MAPLEIPGTSINIPYPAGNRKCTNSLCKRDFNKPKVKTKGDDITVHCPWCNHIIKKLSKKTLIAANKKKSAKKK
jgi:hypothetical protein